MPRCISRNLLAFVGLGLAVSAAPAFAQQEAERANKVYQIFRNNCIECHGADDPKGGLDLRTHATLIAGSQSGDVVVPHQPEKSMLYLLVTHAEEPPMPRRKPKLADGDLALIKQWIEDGASLKDVADAVPDEEKSPEALARAEERPIKDEERQSWAFMKPVRTGLPVVPMPAWQRNPVDAFLLSKIAAKGIKPSPKADKRTLIRRAYLDLLGLPPTPEQVEAFVKDTSPDAWTKLVDSLLASPHYGERWARHWLDLVRYADSGGFEFDVDRPEAWRYRDYIVNSFNKDKPYSQFVREQIAGDEYEPVTEEAMIATGFLRVGPNLGGGERGRQDSLDDLIATTAQTFIGMTVNCARCHNHKFDPIPQKDYYRMQAVFFNTRAVEYPLVPAHEVEANRKENARIDALTKPIRSAKRQFEAPYLKQLVDKEIAQLPDYLQLAYNTPPEKRTEGQKLNAAQVERTLQNDTLRAKITEKDIVALMSAEEKTKHQVFVDQIAELDKQKPKPFPTAMAIGDSGRAARPSYFLHRGSIDTKGSSMKPGVLSVATMVEPAFPEPPPDAKSTYRRRGFAEWLFSPDNPLTARVMVNRIWQHHFGEGIVRTPSNFGKMGEAPSHPELLDWLAVEFAEKGWSVKAMHRLLMTSEAYQMASADIAANVTADPENRLFWRMPRQRIEGEIIRDQILAVAGTLNPTLGGPNIYPYIDPDLFEASSRRNWPGKADSDPSTWRRSIYVYSKRSIRYPFFETFDQPNLVNPVDRRNRSVVAPQALIMMNNAAMFVQAGKFAERLTKEAGTDTKAQVVRGFALALGRAPDAEELAQSIDFIQKGGAGGLADFCHVLFNLNEFVYRP